VSTVPSSISRRACLTAASFTLYLAMPPALPAGGHLEPPQTKNGITALEGLEGLWRTVPRRPPQGLLQGSEGATSPQLLQLRALLSRGR
jgi:hypothetical protein